MTEPVGMVEKEAGPSWARPNWPLTPLDELNLGLDPTQATIDKFRDAAKAAAAETTSRPGRNPPCRRRINPRDDANPHLSRARPSRRPA